MLIISHAASPALAETCAQGLEPKEMRAASLTWFNSNPGMPNSTEVLMFAVLLVQHSLLDQTVPDSHFLYSN